MAIKAVTKSPRAADPWAMLGGVDDARKRLEDGLVLPLARAASLTRLGIRPARGFLIYGPPGMGKSLLVRAAAAAGGANLLSLSAPDLLSRSAGEGEKLLRDAFARVRSGGPAVLFLDELELLAPLRAANVAEPQRNDRMVNILLAEIDRLVEASGAYVVGSTSRPNVIEPALLRPGRLDELVYVAVPDAGGRKAMLAKQTRQVKLAKDVDLTALADKATRFTAADFDDVIRRAGLAALTRNSGAKSVAMADFDVAMKETRASVTEAMEKDYEKVQGEIKQNALKLEAMGFFGPGQLKPVRDSKHGEAERS